MTENCSIPEGYEAVPFSAIFTLGRGLNITKADLVDEGIPCLSYGQIHSKYPRFVSQSVDPLPFAHADNLTTNPQCTLQEGDFAFADTSEDYKGAGNFTCVRDNTPLLAGYHTTIARPNKRTVYSPYVAYFFDSYYFRKQIQTQVCGIKVFSITNSILNSTKVWLPDLSAQKRIAKFLDKKLEAIEAVIRSKNELLTNLTAYRQSLITRAVTKGLDPNVDCMKKVPFKRFIISRNGGMWGSEPGGDEVDALCVRVADFDYANLRTKPTASTMRSISEKQLKKNQLNDGDILLEKSGGGAKTPVGRAVYYSGCNGAICSNFIERLTINRQLLNPKFACYVLSAAYSQRKNLDCIKSKLVSGNP